MTLEYCTQNSKQFGIDMATEYPVTVKICLRPIGQPWVKVGLDDHHQTKQLTTLTDFEYDIDATDTVTLTVEHFDKSDMDPDTAVEIVSISFFGITDTQFVWAGVYTPKYPAHLTGPRELPGQHYLGWNGIWQLTFSVPVFSWMHQKLNLGWLYQ